MKNKKIVLITSAAAVFAATATASIYAAFNSTPVETIPDDNILEENLQTPVIQEETLDRTLFPIREGAEAVRMYEAEDGKEEKLSYSYTRTITEDAKFDVYYDIHNNEYTYNAEGELLGVKNNIDVFKADEASGKAKKVTESEAEELARQYASKVVGDSFDGMKLFDVIKTDDCPFYTMRFKRTYGEGDFADSRFVTIDVAFDGRIMGCYMPGVESSAAFDGSLLEGVTREDVVAFAEAEAHERFPDVTSMTILGIFADVVDGKSVLTVRVEHEAESRPSAEVKDKYDIAIAKTEEPIFSCDYIYELEG